MPRAKKNGSTSRKVDPLHAFVLNNGTSSTSTSFPLSVEQASLSSVLRQQLKGKSKPSCTLELEGATQQNIQDLGNFFVACKGEEAKFSVKFPIGSTTDIASSFDGGPSWLASYVNQVLQTNTVESLLALLYCAVGLHLPHLEQICLVGLAAKFKGKNMEEMQRMLS